MRSIPKKTFMIMRDTSHLPEDHPQRGNDYFHLRYKGSVVSCENARIKWDDWDGSRYATLDEAQSSLENPVWKTHFEGTPHPETGELTGAAKVIEILEEIRYRQPR